MYKFRLVVTNSDMRVDTDEVLVKVSATANAIPTANITSPANNSSFREGTPITIQAVANDFDGSIRQVSFYQNNQLIGTDDTAPYSMQWIPGAGLYSLTVRATDNSDGVGTSQAINVTVAEVRSCTVRSREALQGSFTVGYICTWETVNNDVIITWELLDDRAGVIAYL